MITYPQMQDQVQNRIDVLMDEPTSIKKQNYNWNEIFQNLTTLLLLIVFLSLGLIWK